MDTEQIKHVLKVFSKKCLDLSTRIDKGNELIAKKDKDLVRLVFFSCIQDDVRAMESAYITNNKNLFFYAMESTKEIFEFLA